jgi:uncharacterized protein YhaN
MTATFGKLEHETLTLKPGLNVISAGNEWGKSTWCAFLAAMLFGLDTRAKSTRTTLADKERYAPWSGSPMSGRIDLNWEGRDITIERNTKGRTPLGEFRAYETGSGMTIPELDGKNCGEKLLGVERSVFLRTGFIRFSDLNITDDEALRRRLNSLVTTGDENSDADRLAGELKTMKNRIRHNRTGLLPQAEGERDQLEARLRELRDLEVRNDDILRQLDHNEDWRMALENHKDALAFAASREDARKVDLAEQALREARAEYERIAELCEVQPDRETARMKLEEIHSLQDNLLQLQRRLQNLPREKAPDALPVQFDGLDAEQARDKVWADVFRHEQLRTEMNYRAVFGIVLGLVGLVMMFFDLVPGLICCFAGVVAMAWGLTWKIRRNQQRAELETFYGSADTAHWRNMASDYEEQLFIHSLETEAVQKERAELEEELEKVKQTVREITSEQGLELSRGDWEGALALWEDRDAAMLAVQKAKAHYEDLKAMARQAKAPEFYDHMEYSAAYTDRLLDECMAERTRLENLQGQCRGSMKAIGTKSEIEKELERINERIRGLEQTDAALLAAQETLAQATAELQRRFAPRISQRAGELMQAMTEGRYDRLTIDDDLSLRAGAQQEDTLHEALWRSDGTVDQLYLSLRLAVAEALLPMGPLVLDDALVRFDDNRLKAAMEILKDEAKDRQVILFTCHDRESKLV